MSELDLRDNISALAIAICHKDYLMPEKVFGLLEGKKYTITDEDKYDMLRLKEEGSSYSEIGKIYGYSGGVVCNMIKRYKAKKETLQGSNLSKVNA